MAAVHLGDGFREDVANAGEVAGIHRPDFRGEAAAGDQIYPTRMQLTRRFRRREKMRANQRRQEKCARCRRANRGERRRSAAQPCGPFRMESRKARVECSLGSPTMATRMPRRSDTARSGTRFPRCSRCPWRERPGAIPRVSASTLGSAKRKTKSTSRKEQRRVARGRVRRESGGRAF